MNRNSIYKWLGGSLVAATIAAGFSACSDDHFDISSNAGGKLTIWENIQSQPELSEYKDILEHVYYSQTEDKTTPQTYADIFNGTATYTVWAPVNGSFNYNYYKTLLATGVRDSIYKVEKELIRNNMTRFTNIINSKDSVKLELFNQKAAWLNYAKNTIKGMAITSPNIASANGVLHITSGAVPYQANLYEFMSTRPELDSINTFIKKFQTKEFDKNASTQGPTVNGEITWVDSVTYLSNSYTSSSMDAYIEREDSNYVMILPTNDTWKNVLEKVKPLFVFKDSYKQDVNTQTEAGKDTLISGVETKFSQIERDSLNDLFAKDAICNSLVFNANWQYERIPITSIKDIRNADARLDSLKSTSGITFKKTGTLNATNKGYVFEIDNYAELFGNADPVETSNGQAYIVNDLKFPYSFYAPKRDLDARSYYESADNNCVPSSRTWSLKSHLSITDPETGEETASRDSTYKYSYLVMTNKSATAHPGAFFQLNNTLSCTYDIYVVIGYNYDAQLQNKFRVYISYDTDTKRIINEVLKNPNEDMISPKGENLHNTNFYVNKKPQPDENLVMNYTDTILVAKDFRFPVSYYGLNNAYPTIQIKSNFSSKEKEYYSREIWVNAIIMKPKESMRSE